MGGQPGPRLARLEVVGWHRLWLHEWVRSELGSEGGTLEKFGFQELVEKIHLEGESGAAAGEKGGHSK